MIGALAVVQILFLDRLMGQL
jgi:hypothetical protein